jgi:hypothetical protein
VVHLGAVTIAWRAKRRLPAVSVEKRGAALWSALLLPPQAMRLRALLADGFFPPQHPLAAIVAFGFRKSREHYAFNVIADLRWPIGSDDLSPLAREIAAWFRGALERRVVAELAKAKVSCEELLTPPAPDSPASSTYCPRCRDQFVDQRPYCPNGVALRALSPSDPGLPGKT